MARSIASIAADRLAKAGAKWALAAPAGTICSAIARRLRTKLSRALRSTSTSCSATLALHRRSGFLVCQETNSTSGLRAGSTAGRHAGPTRAAAEPGLRLRSGDQAFPDRRLSRSFARPAYRFRLLAGFALGGLFVGAALFHLAEDAFALHLLFQRPERLIDVVVANEDLQRTYPLVSEADESKSPWGRRIAAIRRRALCSLRLADQAIGSAAALAFLDQRQNGGNRV